MKACCCLILSLVLYLGAFAQKNHYYAFTFGKDFPKHYHVIGGYFSANKELAKDFFAGAGFAITKFDHIEKLYFPVYANFSFMPGRSTKKFFPVFLLQPGYGFYKREENGVSTMGGFTFHVSGGIGYPFLFKTKGYTTIGLGHYGFRGAETDKTSYGARIGMMF